PRRRPGYRHRARREPGYRRRAPSRDEGTLEAADPPPYRTETGLQPAPDRGGVVDMSLAHLTLPTRQVERTAALLERTLGYRRKTVAANSPVEAVWLDLG